MDNGITRAIVLHVKYGYNYHPWKWIELRPELRYAYTSHPSFGENHNFRNQLTLALDVLMKF